ncbi:unnamed protein product, partial [marine sediment metagenome]
NFTGEYFIYLDNQLVENKNITFPKYWEPLKVKYYLEEITDGLHQISIVVADEGGHLSIDSEFYENIGSIKFRIGQKIELILGLSLGIGVPVLFVAFFIWVKYLRKKN